MVHENLVFRTSVRKVSSEDILRALRVSSFFTFLRDVGFPVYESTSLADFTINGRYGRNQNLLQCEYTYVNSLTCVWDTVYKLSEKFFMRFLKNFLIAFARMCRYFVFCVLS